MARVQIERVSKVYGKSDTPAVREVSLQIEHGEFLVLLGPSGCGKSTLLRMIAGLEDISGGEVRIEDRVVNDVAPKDRDIAMVFQNYALYPHMTVRDNMAFGLKLRRTAKDEIARRVDDAARILGLTPLLERRPRELSGGQMQRVAVGRAIVREPKVFLFDEPLSNLDAKLRGEMRVELKRLHQRLGATMIYVTHDQVEAMTLGDRVAVLNAGALQQVAPPLEVYRRPANRFVAGFLGNPPMNFIPGRIEGDAFAAEGGARLALPPAIVASLGERPAVVGVRPEDVEISAGTDEGIAGRVEVREVLGSEAILYVRVPGLAGGPLAVQARSEIDVDAGADVRLRPSAERLHVFDEASGARIAGP